MQVIHAVAYSTKKSDYLYLDDSRHSYHCTANDGASSHSWGIFFNGSEPKPFPSDPALLVSCSKLSTSDVLQKREELAHSALAVSPAELSGHEDDSDVKHLYMMLADATRKVWVFTEPMQQIIDYETEYIRIMRGHRLVIGIQARGGDKLEEQLHYASLLKGDSLAAHMGAFQSVKEQYHDRLSSSICILVGDDMNVAEQMTKVATAAFGCMVINRVLPMPETEAHQESHFNSLPVRQRCYSTFRVLADVEVLANTDIFIGMRNSNVASMVAAIRRFIYGKEKASEFELSGTEMVLF